MIKMLDRVALPAALVLALGLTGQAAQAKFTIVPESSSISLLAPGLIVIAGFALFKVIRARSQRKA